MMREWSTIIKPVPFLIDYDIFRIQIIIPIVHSLKPGQIYFGIYKKTYSLFMCLKME